MEVDQNVFRATILHDYKKNMTYDQSFESLRTEFGDSAPSLSSVSYWFRKFKRRRNSLNVGSQPGRPAEAVCEENIGAFDRIIRERRNVTHREIQQEVRTGSAASNTILH